MSTDQIDELADLRSQIASLAARVSSLEDRLEELHPAGEITDETLLAISAAVAAFLGKNARVRQVHLRRDSGWARRGRFDIQHSHNPGARG